VLLSYEVPTENIFINFDKKIGLATFWDIFFKNSSGNPECNADEHPE
jgi:hypothetical protein